MKKHGAKHLAPLLSTQAANDCSVIGSGKSIKLNYDYPANEDGDDDDDDRKRQ